MRSSPTYTPRQVARMLDSVVELREALTNLQDAPHGRLALEVKELRREFLRLKELYETTVPKNVRTLYTKSFEPGL
jgi:hypothetical protein